MRYGEPSRFETMPSQPTAHGVTIPILDEEKLARGTVHRFRRLYSCRSILNWTRKRRFFESR
jgi:hypothetical protein